MKKYRLLKDLPTFKAGDIFELRTNGLWLVEQSENENHWKPEVMAYHKMTLDRFPSILEKWFEEIKSKEYWCVDWTEPGVFKTEHEDKRDDFNESIGNHFGSRKEATQAIKKLKAWKRLRDKGFRFTDYDVAEPVGDGEFCGQAFFRGGNYGRYEIRADLNLLFGGEDEA